MQKHNNISAHIGVKATILMIFFVAVTYLFFKENGKKAKEKLLGLLKEPCSSKVLHCMESRFTNLLPQNVPKEFYQLAATCQKKITDLLPVPKEFYQLAAARDRWSRGCFLA